MTTCFVRISVEGLHVAFVAERLRRYDQVVVVLEGVGSSPTECSKFFSGLAVCFVLVGLLDRVHKTKIRVCSDTIHPQNPNWEAKQNLMAVPGFETGSRGSQPLMLTTTLYRHG